MGIWREEARLDCKAKTWSAPPKPIRELHIRAAGEIQVTWLPFEAYRDYVASFVWDPAATTMTFKVTDGNYIPKDVHTSGTARVEKGALIERE